MDNANYISLSRQSGLMKELTTIANNMANADTVGYKREGAIFSEYIAAASANGEASSPRHSLSIGRLAAHASNFDTGSLRMTGGSMDVAIEGDGFFLVDVNGQTQLTRAGNFMTDENGRLITVDGNAVLDNAEGEIQIPLEAGELSIALDGTLSGNGVELGRLGVVTADPNTLSRQGNNNWVAENGFEPLEEARVLQGFLEDSNVEPVSEIARMIEVQRFYDAGQKILEMEDSRIKQVITTIRQIS
jgi:flagellar basal-body rod protein FlgF